MPHESLPPFVIITAAMTAIGLIQGAIYTGVFGRTKHTGSDAWDMNLRKRDDQIIKRLKEEKQNSQGSVL